MAFMHDDDAAWSASTLNLVARSETYIHPSWLSKVLAGDRQCLASVYIQANYLIPKGESDFDVEGYRLKHQTALTRYARKLREDGYTVHAENSNSFQYRTKVGAKLSAKPDIVAFRDDEVIVPDIKTGKELKACDIAQVKLYMALIPAVGLHGIRSIPIGQLVHNDQVFEVAPNEVTAEFKQQVTELVSVLRSENTPPFTPSVQECRFCPLRHLCPNKARNTVNGSDDWL